MTRKVIVVCDNCGRERYAMDMFPFRIVTDHFSQRYGGDFCSPECIIAFVTRVLAEESKEEKKD